MITKQQFDALLDMVQINLNDQEYEQMFHQMEDIMWFIDMIKEIPFDTLTVWNAHDSDPYISLIDRSYINQTIDLSWSHHPLINNMLQLRFKKES